MTKWDYLDPSRKRKYYFLDILDLTEQPPILIQFHSAPCPGTNQFTYYSSILITKFLLALLLIEVVHRGPVFLTSALLRSRHGVLDLHQLRIGLVPRTSPSEVFLHALAYTGRPSRTGESDIEHLVAVSEGRDSGDVQPARYRSHPSVRTRRASETGRLKACFTASP